MGEKGLASAPGGVSAIPGVPTQGVGGGGGLIAATDLAPGGGGQIQATDLAPGGGGQIQATDLAPGGGGQATPQPSGEKGLSNSVAGVGPILAGGGGSSGGGTGNPPDPSLGGVGMGETGAA